jgi:glycosyltransferase involved in cell wall biosynthesis
MQLSQNSPTAFSLPAISVLIRTRDSARTLERVIQGLAQKPGDEVIVVDSGSTDSTINIAQRLGASVVTASGPFNYSKSLNLGFAAAKNPWVLVISSHAIPIVPNFLDRYREAIQQFPPDIVVGYGPSTISEKSASQYGAQKVQYLDASTYMPLDYICGNGNAVYRRDIWEEFAFDESVRTAEDKLWMHEAFQRGYRTAFVPAPVTLNCNQASLSYMFRKGYSDARARTRRGSGTDVPEHRKMRLHDLAGAMKNLGLRALRGEVNFSNWLRYSAHILGQFFGSRGPQNNSPDWK